MNKLITVTMIAYGVLFSDTASADPGHEAVIEPTYEFLHFITSPDHLLPVSAGLAFLTYLAFRKRRKSSSEENIN